MGGVWKPEVQAALLRNVAGQGEQESQFPLEAWAVCLWAAGAAGMGDLDCRGRRAGWWWGGGGDLGRHKGTPCLALEFLPQALFASCPVPKTQPR